MLRKLRSGLTFANVCSFLALTEALGTGRAYAANTIDGTVKAADLADGGVTSTDLTDNGTLSKDIANGAVTTDDIEDGTITEDDAQRPDFLPFGSSGEEQVDVLAGETEDVIAVCPFDDDTAVGGGHEVLGAGQLPDPNGYVFASAPSDGNSDGRADSWIVSARTPAIRTR